MSTSRLSDAAAGDAAQVDHASVQDGIYFRHGESALRCYRLLLLDIKPGAELGKAKADIHAVWSMLSDLCRGIAPDLPEAQFPAAGLSCLLGFGSRLFDHDDRQVMGRPEALRPLGAEPFPSLRWVAGSGPGAGEADLALQFIADSDLAVNQAVVEVWLLIRKASLALTFVAVHEGYHRGDGRSWIGFCDGLGNIETSLRGKAIQVADQSPAWMNGGTYMGFLRLAVDLEPWRALPRQHQELIVGRDKMTGAPLESVDPGLQPVAMKFGAGSPGGCPMSGDRLPPSFYDPPPPPATLGLLRASHIHRANPNRRVGAVLPDDNRIFRQGYEFAEVQPQGRLRIGLNFVSFQRDLDSLIHMLIMPGWLGNANFGGVVDPQGGEPARVSMLGLIAGGYYAVPPKGQPFPGAGIF